MGKLSEAAFAIMGMCENERKPFGITVDKRGNAYAFCWAFKMSKEQAAREGYDKTHVRGAIVYDDDFNGCPYCGSKGFYICNRCGKVVCYDGREMVTCPNCGTSSGVVPGKTFDLSGGGM